MDGLFSVKFLVTLTVLSVIQYNLVNANDAEFGRIITFDNFDHFKVSQQNRFIVLVLKKKRT